MGMGRFAQAHLPCLRQIPDVVLAAVCDIVADNAFRAAEEWSCNGYTDWRIMLEREKLDCVMVLTPEAERVDPVVGALEAGCDVFLEKPLATDTSSAVQMIEKMREVGRLLMVGHILRFDPRYIHIRECVEQNRFGTLRSLYARRSNGNRYFPLYSRSHPIFILGIHDIDLMHWFTDSDVEEVCSYSSGAGDGQSDLVWAMLKFRNGSIGVLENHWLIPDQAPSFMDVLMEVVGDSCTAHVQDPDHTLRFWDQHGVSVPSVFSGSTVYGSPVGPLMEELRHFFSCVRERKPSSILRPADALAAVRVAEAVVRSAAGGGSVSLAQP